MKSAKIVLGTIAISFFCLGLYFKITDNSTSGFMPFQSRVGSGKWYHDAIDGNALIFFSLVFLGFYIMVKIAK